MRRSLHTPLAILLAGLLAPAFAAEPPATPSSADQQAMMAAWQKAATPGAQHAQLAEHFQGAWTTKGLWKNMQLLFQHFTGVSTKVLSFANQIKGLVDATYAHFHQKFGFARLSPPELNLEKHTLTMTGLQETTKQFCHEPINVMTEKHFLIDKFYESLVSEARRVFQATRTDAER